MSGINRTWIIAIVVIAIVLIAGSYLVFFRGNNNNTSTDLETIPTSTEEPTPTPQPELPKEEIQIRVLNGSGVAGEAALVKGILEDAGFTVSETDNAETDDFTDTEIQAKNTISSEVLDELKKLLEEDYTVTTSTLDESEEVDIIIIVGKRTNAPTTAPTKAAPTGSQTTSTPTPTGSTSTPTPTPAP